MRIGLGLNLRQFIGAIVVSLTAPVLTKTSATGGVPTTFDATLAADATPGLILRIQRYSDLTLTTLVQDLIKPVQVEEFGTTNNVAWLTTDINPPRDYTTGVITSLNTRASGQNSYRARLERDDGAVSAWSNTISDTLVVVALATSGTGKNVNLTLSNGNKTWAGNGFGAIQLVRSDTASSGSGKTVAMTLTVAAGSNGIFLGFEDGTTDFSANNPAIPGWTGTGSAKGVTVTGGSYGFDIRTGGTVLSSNYTGGANAWVIGDIIQLTLNTTAGTLIAKRNGTQIGSTVTGLALSAYYAFTGTDGDAEGGTMDYTGY